MITNERKEGAWATPCRRPNGCGLGVGCPGSAPPADLQSCTCPPADLPGVLTHCGAHLEAHPQPISRVADASFTLMIFQDH